VPADWAYTYDPIGNRAAMTADGSVAMSYESNVLNQYRRTLQDRTPPVAQGYSYDADCQLSPKSRHGLSLQSRPF
jgi:hypothetical protein